MTFLCGKSAFFVYLLGTIALPLFTGPAVHAADHGDTNVLIGIPRHDARITDLFSFTNDDNLVLILGTDPTAGPPPYVFPDDLKLEIFIDNDKSDVVADGLPFGGTIGHPGGIRADIAFVITFRRGTPRLKIKGAEIDKKDVKFSAGAFDDPFIRTPRIGKNVAAVVIEVPLGDVEEDQSILLIWAASNVPDFEGPRADSAGRALRNQFPNTAAKTGEVSDSALNLLHPSKHHLLGVPPDVIIFDTWQPAVFPNGRALEDDVVDLLGLDLPGEDPATVANDVPFLDDFPYLAPAHP